MILGPAIYTVTLCKCILEIFIPIQLVSIAYVFFLLLHLKILICEKFTELPRWSERKICQLLLDRPTTFCSMKPPRLSRKGSAYLSMHY